MSSYQIRSGDTLSVLARRFNTTVAPLAQANKIANPDLILAGKQLQIPGRADSYDGAKKAGPVDLTGTGSNRGQGGGTGAAVGGDYLSRARSLIGTQYDRGWMTGSGNDPSKLHCAELVNAVYPNLPRDSVTLTRMGTRGRTPQPGDVVCSNMPAPAGHVGILTDRGTVIHSIPSKGVHESSLADFKRSSPITSVIPASQANGQ